MTRFLALTGISWLLAVAQASAEVNYETLTFLGEDGHRYVNYATTRSDGASYTVFMDKQDDLADYLYVSPNRYEFDPESTNEANLLKFQQGSYALMSEGDYLQQSEDQPSRVSIDADGVYTLNTWDGRVSEDGYHGIWNKPTNFNNFAAAWVFPAHFEVLSYKSNQIGDWVQRGNTLAFFGEGVNNLTFELRYRPKHQNTYAALSEQLAEMDTVDVRQDADGLTVIMRNEILFASGSADLSAEGQQILRNMVSNLPASDYEIIVAGHTDDVPIRGNLQHRYPTNWELSAARAMNVVHVLRAAGVDPGKLEARAYGAHQPRVPNTDDANRRVNRRIELMIQPAA